MPGRHRLATEDPQILLPGACIAARSAGPVLRTLRRLRRYAAGVALGLALMGAEGRGATMQARIDALPPGQWLEIDENAAGTVRGTALARVYPPREGHPAWGMIGPRGVVDAWGGGAYDTRRDLFLLAGGGHRDYGGNEVYAFDMRTLEWRRLTEPSRYETDFSDTVDGTPRSRHTYDGLEYHPGLDRLTMVGGATWITGSAIDRHLWLFDPAARTWQKRAPAPPAFSGGPPATAYDPKTGQLYAHVAGNLARYDPQTDRWAMVAAEANIYQGAMEFDPDSRVLILAVDGKVWSYTPDARIALRRPVPVPEDIARAIPPSWLGLAYDPKGRKIAGWAGKREVWTLDTRSMAWKTASAAAGPAPSQGANSHGIYGRWRYVPSRDVFIGLPSADRNVWVFRPPRGEP